VHAGGMIALDLFRDHPAPLQPIADPSPNLRALVGVFGAVIEVGALGARTEVHRNYRDAKHAQAVNHTTSDTPFIHKDEFRLVRMVCGGHLRRELHRVEAEVNLDLTAAPVHSAAGIDNRGVVTEPAYVHAKAHTVT